VLCVLIVIDSILRADMANPKLQYSILMRSPVARSQDLADGFVRSVSLV
jgi:hypothetical protein